MRGLILKWLWCASVCLPLCSGWAQTDKEAVISAPPEEPIIEQPWIQMYGVRLNSAMREDMRQALRAHGLKAVREDSRYWVDVYDAKGLLSGASQFYVGYVAATQQLAFAEYAFANFMDSTHTQQIVKMVTGKYGPPTEIVGQLAMGSYTARWMMADGIQIQVVREWPETSTYLKFLNSKVEAEMKAELAKETMSRQKAKKSNEDELHKVSATQ